MADVITFDSFMSARPEDIQIAVDGYERRTGMQHIDFCVTLTIPPTTASFYKRYNEFKNFDASLKAAFPGVELPKFPSKFALVNKNEVR